MWTVKQVPSRVCHDLILHKHYARRLPSISYAYGIFPVGGDDLLGIVTFGSPASPSLCTGIAGEEMRSSVLELNRLCLVENVPNMASFLVSHALRLLPPGRVIVSYADTAQGHHGGVYQACSFLFTGTTRPRTDIAGKDGKHSRHHLGDPSIRVPRSAKHRYVTFTGNGSTKRRLQALLRYPVLPYPKPMIEGVAL